MEEALFGLLECPMQNGYIEFTYHPGDLVSELHAQTTAAWGDAIRRRVLRGSESWWVLLFQDQQGAYVRMRDDEPIPLNARDLAAQDVPTLDQRSDVLHKGLGIGLFF